MGATAFIEVLKQALAREPPAAADNTSELRIADLDRVMAPTLAPEAEAQLLALHPHMRIPQRREAEGAVVPDVLLVTNPDQRRFEQPHDRGRDFLPRQPGQPHVRTSARSQAGQRTREIQQACVL